jgi:hypothetical protein
MVTTTIELESDTHTYVIEATGDIQYRQHAGMHYIGVYDADIAQAVAELGDEIADMTDVFGEDPGVVWLTNEFLLFAAANNDYGLSLVSETPKA